MSLPELLAPAGNREKLETAIAYGADAVYLGGTNLNLRAKAQGFSPADLPKALDFAHTHGVKVYYCLNILAWEKHLPGVTRDLEYLATLPVDGLIIADPGIVLLAKKIAPHIPIHLSTQANTSNSASTLFWQEIGISRVNLARELSARGIRAIAENAPGMELELFVHGAMCMAISGRCLLSAYLNKRSANQGLCTHPCRFDYKPVAIKVDERTRPGEALWEITEDEDYSRIFSAQDLCLIKYLPWFHKNRITALKIEGRMKTSAYLCQVVDTYRTALNDLTSRTFRPKLYLENLSRAASRPLSSGFFCPTPTTFFTPNEEPEKTILARVIKQIGPTSWEIATKNPWDTQAPVAILAPGLNRPVLSPASYRLEKETGEAITMAHPGLTYFLRTEHPSLLPHLFIEKSQSQSV